MKLISRKEARAAGVAAYFTGKPCNLGLIAERDVKEKKCQCAAHKAARKAAMRQRYLKNRQHRIERAAHWAKANPEKRKSAARKWAGENGSSAKANTHKRRARKLNATPAWFGEFDELVMQAAHELTAIREAATGIKWEVDHVVPLAGKKVCGLHVAGNIQVIPMAANRRKSNSHSVA
jgi:hypothetical protein